MLDLTFLATGFWQHVFTHTGQSNGWVYKIPVVRGHTLSFDRERLYRKRPQHALRNVAHSLLFRLPLAIRDRLPETYGTNLRGRGYGLPDRLAASAESVSRAFLRTRDLAFDRYSERRRLKNFARMITILDYITKCDLQDITLPYHVVQDGDALLRLDQVVVRYRGPIVVQREAVVLRLTGEDYRRSFGWHELVAAQHLLWKHGVALRETGEILGPRSWTIYENQLRLADTSSLTRDIRVARRSLSDESLDKREQVVFRRLTKAGALPNESLAQLVREYHRFVRAEINATRLDQLWAAELKQRRRSASLPTIATAS